MKWWWFRRLSRGGCEDGMVAMRGGSGCLGGVAAAAAGDGDGGGKSGSGGWYNVDVDVAKNVVKDKGEIVAKFKFAKAGKPVIIVVVAKLNKAKENLSKLKKRVNQKPCIPQKDGKIDYVIYVLALKSYNCISLKIFLSGYCFCGVPDCVVHQSGMNGYVAYKLDKPRNKGLKKSLKVAAKVVVAVVAKVEAKEAVVVEKVVVTQLKVAVVAVARAGEDQFHEGARDFSWSFVAAMEW
nr:asparagine--tRNA ligase, cytoplasmic 1-like [Tanacetum cinerariifolium]